LCVVVREVIDPGRHVALGLHHIVSRFLFTDRLLDLVNDHPEGVLLPIFRRIHLDSLGDGEQRQFPDTLPAHHGPIVLRRRVRSVLVLPASIPDAEIPVVHVIQVHAVAVVNDLYTFLFRFNRDVDVLGVRVPCVRNCLR